MQQNSFTESARIKLTEILSSMIEGKESLDKLEAVTTIMEWYKEAKTKPNLNLTGLSNKIANKIVEYIVEPLLEPLVKDIKIKIQSNSLEIKFNSKLFKSELKPYAEFVKKMNGNSVATIKIRFQITAEIKLNNVEIKRHNDDLMVNLGTLTGILEAAITSLNTPIAQHEKPIPLGKKEFSIILPSIGNKDL